MKVTCETPFFIWFTGRTGSTLLCDLLNSHPDVYCRMEDFSEVVLDLNHGMANENVREFKGVHYSRRICSPKKIVHDPNREQILEHLQWIYSGGSAACGFKFRFPAQAAVFPEVLETLQPLPGMKVIELIRDNTLKQAISLQNVDRVREDSSQVSCNLTSHTQLDPLQLNVELAIKHARFFLNSRQAFRRVTNEFSHVLRVSYEDLNQNISSTTARVLGFLGVDVAPELATSFFKTTPDQIADAVANYDELVQAVAGTDLEAFLD